jgi:hypothetical protein
MKQLRRSGKFLSVLMLCVTTSACDTYYRYDSTGQDTGRITVSGSSYVWDLVFFGLLVAVASGYPFIYKNITHQEMGRRRIFALRGILGLIAAAFFYNRTYYNLKHYWEVDPGGVREVSLYGVQEMKFDDAYRVVADRQNVRDVTKEMKVPSPMFEAIGPGNKAVVVRGEEVGHDAFEGFSTLAMELYFRRDKLWKPPVKEGAAVPPAGAGIPVDAAKPADKAGTPPAATPAVQPK